MKAKPKKKSKDKPPPSSPIPPEFKKLVPNHPDVSLLDVLRNAEDTMALQVGNNDLFLFGGFSSASPDESLKYL